MIVVVGLIALFAVAGFALFGSSVFRTAKCQGDSVTNLGSGGPCGPAGSPTGGQLVASNAKSPTGPTVDTNGPICDRMGRCSGGGNCFAAGTPVVTARGIVPIETVHAGDRVWSAALEDATGEAQRPVERVVETKDREVLELDVQVEGTAGAEHLRVTPDHAFWVDDRGWVRAADLTVGTRLHGAEGASASVVATRRTGEHTTVYNLEVAEVHTYFAGSSRLLSRYTCERLPATDALRTAAREGALWEKKRFEAIDRLAAAKDLTDGDYAILADAVAHESDAKAAYAATMRAKGHEEAEIASATGRPWFGRAAEALAARP